MLLAMCLGMILDKGLLTLAEVGQGELKLECTRLPHLNNHVIPCNQQDSINKVLLTHYTLGTATKPVGNKSC